MDNRYYRESGKPTQSGATQYGNRSQYTASGKANEQKHFPENKTAEQKNQSAQQSPAKHDKAQTHSGAQTHSRPQTQAWPKTQAEQRKLVYVCSPYRVRNAKPGTEAYQKELDANIRRAKSACKLITDLGYIPIAPHLYFTQFLDDETPEERELGMLLGSELLAKCDELWAFGTEATEGMQREIAQAKANGMKALGFKSPDAVRKAAYELAKIDFDEVFDVLNLCKRLAEVFSG